MPLAAVPAETDDEAVADRGAPELSERDNRELPLHLREGGAEGQELGRVGRAQAAFVEFDERIVGRDVAIQVDQFDLDVFGASLLLREMLVGDVVVLPVEGASRDQFLDGRRAVVRHGDRVGSGGVRSVALDPVRVEGSGHGLHELALAADGGLGLLERQVVRDGADQGGDDVLQLFPRHGADCLIGHELFLSVPRG